MTHKNNLAFVNGKRTAAHEVRLVRGRGIPEQFCDVSAADLIQRAVLPWVTAFENDFEAGFKAVVKFDEWSFRRYLSSVAQWPHEVIDFVEMMTSQTNQFDLGFIEVIMQCLDFGTKGAWEVSVA